MVTATSLEGHHTRIMEHVLQESAYVLAVLYQMRAQVSANPKLFDPDAPERINEAIARIEDVLRSTQSQLTIESVEKNLKAA